MSNMDRNRGTATPLSRSSYADNKHRSLSELVAMVPPQHDVLEMTLAEILCYALVPFPSGEALAPVSVEREA